MPGPGNDEQMARVVKYIKGNDGQPISSSGSSNPILDASEYLVKFNDGSTKQLTANLITESIFSMVDDEGWYYQLFKEISKHRKNKEAFTKSKNNNKNKAKQYTTKGWEFLVHWHDDSSSWVSLTI